MTLRITDSKNVGTSRSLSFDLRDILVECTAYQDRRWLAWNVDCFGSEWFEVFQNAPNNQKELSFSELNTYANEVGQTIDGHFLALKDSIKVVPQLKSTDDCVKNADPVIIAFDSTFFDVITNDQNLISRLSEKFKKVEFVTR